MANKKVLIFLIGGLAIGLAAVLIFLPGQKQKQLAAVKTGFKSEAVLSEPELNWQTYENKEYGVKFEYPPELETEELVVLATDFLQINILAEDQTAQAIVMVMGNYQADDVKYFVGVESDKQVNINGQSWYYFNFPQGFSNSPAFTAYQNEKGGLLYSFKFYESMDEQLRDQIMARAQIGL